ncbi:relaxase/mobilization nuclease domain-containing protein [Mucilaginibacter terrae]|uniref:relaxase/mobilization nuclease domain-containing protein n=1 Tax=Mucilaginibacter terrae TaxID=1955052 RepID=UPI003628EA2E
MVIRGGTRGNGLQLARYLTTKSDNERIQILEAAGRENASADYLRQTIISMDLMADLTKAKNSLYHAQINPAYDEDKNTDWFKAADILGKELGFEDQRRVIVLHEKKGRTHAHVVWERYDHEKGIVISDSFSRLAQDRARRSMEMEFGHKPTPRRNAHRPELKASLLQLWNQTGTGAQFLTACKNNNYMIAAGSGRNPFIVVDENGRSFDLVRQLKGVRLTDVRERLRNETLMTEKQAIVYMRNQSETRQRERDERGKQKAHFKMNASDQTKATPKQEPQTQPKRMTQAERDAAFKEILQAKKEITQPEISREELKQQFAQSKENITISKEDQLRKALQQERNQQQDRGHDLNRDNGMEWD